MDREEKILKILSDVEFNEDEFKNIDIELNHLETRKLKKEYKKRILNSNGTRSIKRIAACLIFIGILGGGIISMPVIAKNIELSSFFYKEITDGEGYLNYYDVIGNKIIIDDINYEVGDIKVDNNLATIKIIISNINNRSISDDSLNKITAKGWFKESYKYGEEYGEIKRISKNKIEITFNSLINTDCYEDIYFMDFNINGKSTKINAKLKLKDYNNLNVYEKIEGKTINSGDYIIEVSKIEKISDGTNIKLKVIGNNKYSSDLLGLRYTLDIDGNEYVLGTEFYNGDIQITSLGYPKLNKNEEWEGYILEIDEFLDKDILDYDNISKDSKIKLRVYKDDEIISEIE